MSKILGADIFLASSKNLNFENAHSELISTQIDLSREIEKKSYRVATFAVPLMTKIMKLEIDIFKCIAFSKRNVIFF
jgi:hypothetical protein